MGAPKINDGDSTCLSAAGTVQSTPLAGAIMHQQFNYTQNNSNKELPWLGFEPTTLCSLSRALLPTEPQGQLSRQGLKSTTQYKAKANLNSCAIAQ